MNIERHEIWARFMAAAISALDDDEAHLATRANRAAYLADYALGEYEQRCVGRDEDGTPHFEPIYSSQYTKSNAA
jgi:hypothetical protein